MSHARPRPRITMTCAVCGVGDAWSPKESLGSQFHLKFLDCWNLEDGTLDRLAPEASKMERLAARFSNKTPRRLCKLPALPVIRRPLLARGNKAAGLGLIRFLTIIGHALNYQAICCYRFSGPTSLVDPPRRIHLSRRSVSAPKNPSACRLVFKAQQIRKTAPKAPRKRRNSNPKFIKTMSVKN